MRLGVRLCTKVPAMPAAFSPNARIAAKIGHAMLYLFMLMVPLSGWVMVSASIFGLPTIVFGWFTFPHVPGIASNPVIEQGAKMVHQFLAFGFGGMIMLHLVALVKHAWTEKINLLPRMGWGRIAVILAGAVVITGTASADSAPVRSWQIDKAQSQITFSGTHAGSAFSGTFSDWQADIQVDPAHPEQGHVVVDFAPASAHTGNLMYDGTLPQADWFDVKNHPKAHFASRQITSKADGLYHVLGDLTVRGITQPIAFDVRLSDITKPPVRIQARFTIVRLAYDIGRQSDPSAAWVSAEIPVVLDLVATP